MVKEGDRVGLISIRDLTKALALGRSLGDFIEPRFVTPVSSKDPIFKAIAIMSEHNLRHLPVLQEDTIKMISVKEIAKHVTWIQVKSIR